MRRRRYRSVTFRELSKLIGSVPGIPEPAVRPVANQVFRTLHEPPELLAALRHLDAAAAELREWWAEDASSDPRFPVELRDALDAGARAQRAFARRTWRRAVGDEGIEDVTTCPEWRFAELATACKNILWEHGLTTEGKTPDPTVATVLTAIAELVWPPKKGAPRDPDAVIREARGGRLPGQQPAASRTARSAARRLIGEGYVNVFTEPDEDEIVWLPEVTPGDRT